MPTNFNNEYTELEDINNGNQLQNGDDILAPHMNSALQNTAHLKTLLNNMVVRNVRLVNKLLYIDLATKGNSDSSATTQTITIDAENINGVAMVKQFYVGGNDWEISIKNSPNNNTQIEMEVGYTYYDSEAEYEEKHFKKLVLSLGRLSIQTYHDTSSQSTNKTWTLDTHPCFIRIKNNPDTAGGSLFSFDSFLVLNTSSKVTSMGDLSYYVPDMCLFPANGTFGFLGSNHIVAGMYLDKTTSKAKIIYYADDNSLSETTLWIDYTSFIVTSEMQDF